MMIKRTKKVYSNELRDEAFLLMRKKKKSSEIARKLGISLRTVLRWKKAWEMHGVSYAKKNYRRGKKSSLNQKIIDLLKINYPEITQKEIVLLYYQFTGKIISQSTISKYINKKIKQYYKDNRSSL